MSHIGGRNKDSLLSAETFGFAHVKKAFDFFIDATDCLDVAALIHRTGHGNPLLDGDLRQC